ncbi:MAG: DUF4249 domain-containing protein [Bacteroidales bacterium]|nr:DUF4249 domain-containing protein [Bacteroidales bacterium]
MFIACQDDLNIPDTGRKIVINGLITTDSLLNVFINRSVFITTNSNIYMSDLDNAEVCFYQNNAFIDSLHHFYKVFDGWHVFHPGNYWSKSVFPLPGEEYKIVVKVPGLPDATATTTIPNLVKIERIDTSRIILASGNGPDFRMRYNIEFTDPANETNYYLFNLSNTFSKMLSCNPFPFVSQDPIIEEILSRGTNYVEALVFSDKIINGQKHSLTVTTDGYNSGRNITTYFRLFSITEECFKYIQTLNLYFEKQGNPLSEPVTVYSNVTGGYGIFTGAAVSSDSIVVPY